MNKTLLASAMLLATSAAYNMDHMDLDEIARKHIIILQQSFPTLKPIARKDPAAGSTDGVIHAYYSSDTKQAHVLTVRPNFYEQFCIDENGKTILYRIIDLVEYVTKFDDWEILTEYKQYNFLTKLQLDYR